MQRSKLLVFTSLGLVDFAVRLVDLILHLPDEQVKYHKHSAYKNLFGASKNDVGQTGKFNFSAPRYI